MRPLPKQKTEVYILNESHIEKLDELISELQCFYCDIFSNRGLSVTKGLEARPVSGFLNALSENGLSVEDVTAE